MAIIGGGAAGFFAAITAAEANPLANVRIYEKGNTFLTKVKISGGGRCNVTHACFDPALLAKNYPRGPRELRGAFHRWQPQDTIEWFAKRGVTLKTEADGRIFPDTDRSQTIIDCFLESARKANIKLHQGMPLKAICRSGNQFTLKFGNDSELKADKVCITSGSLKASPLTSAIESLGHTIEPLAPSLFSFNVADPRIEGLAGLAVRSATVRSLPKNSPQTGPILITHRGFSGPAILRLSAWEARSLQEQNYQFDISINWLGDTKAEKLRSDFSKFRASSGKALVKNRIPEEIPRRLWERLLHISEISSDTQWSQLAKGKENQLIRELIEGRYTVTSKTTNKEEFVTCGGIRLKEVDFRTMESKLVPGLYFAGECLDIDGITGGFNFQAAWTGGHIAGLAMANV
ncbi:MAG: NAD(P)/FAD-dependent oxidoreductase [Akkermansiaceae bacterium]